MGCCDDSSIDPYTKQNERNISMLRPEYKSVTNRSYVDFSQEQMDEMLDSMREFNIHMDAPMKKVSKTA